MSDNLFSALVRYNTMTKPMPKPKKKRDKKMIIKLLCTTTVTLSHVSFFSF